MNVINYKNHAFTDETIVSGSVHVTNAMVCETLEADTLTATVIAETVGGDFFTSENLKFNTSDNEDFNVGTKSVNLKDYQYGEPIEYYHDDILVGKFYLRSTQRIGKATYILDCVSAVGLLIYQQHIGGVYSGETVENVVSEIMGNIPYTISSDIASIPVYGHLPIASARDNLQQLLFSLGASIRKDENGKVNICYNQPDEAISVDQSRLYTGGKVNYNTKATKVTVTEHSYYASTSVAEKVLYDNTQSTAADNVLVTFSNPCHSLTSVGLTIVASGANYAIVSGTGSLSGKEYVHTTRDLSIVTDATNLEPHEVTVKDATFVSPVNVNNVLKRVANYYSRALEVEYGIVAGDEKTGDLIAFTNPFGESAEGYIKEMNYIMSGTLKAEATVIQNWKPQYVGNAYTNYKIVTSEDLVNGVWNVPTEMVGKKALLVLFGGGSGGNGGYDGRAGGACSGTSIYWYSSTAGYNYYRYAAGGLGGEGGEGGHPGNILKADIESLASSYTASFGLGGEGGLANGGVGAEGTHSTFGDYDSDNGTRFEGTYINLINGEELATSGANGYKGGNGGSTGVVFDVNNPADRGNNGRAGEAVENYPGGNGSDLFKYNWGSGGSGEVTENGSGGGGSAYGRSGTDAVPMRQQSEGSSQHINGIAGSGADAVAPNNATFASGGAGGNGGGGSGARGYGLATVPGGRDQTWNSTAGSIGHGTKGANGGNGFALIYYGDE